MSSYSEDDIRRAAEIREWLMKQIADKQEELDRLRSTLAVVDSLLKQGSFKAAATLATEQPRAQIAPAKQAMATAPPPPAKQSSFEVGKEVRPLKRAKDDFVLANAEVTPGAVVIVPVPEIALNINTPPFRSFFLNRILEGMKTKDAERVGQGALKEPDTLNYRVEDESGLIKRIVINNYREKERLSEIFNTSAWVFTRMLEKAGS
jgi:hypothetical protein